MTGGEAGYDLTFACKDRWNGAAPNQILLSRLVLWVGDNLSKSIMQPIVKNVNILA
jgi:hypothetical protein